jgi:ABC-type uncharacterized transport system substrate-binding protein
VDAAGTALRAAALMTALGLLAAPLATEAQPRGGMPRVAVLCAVFCDALFTSRHEEWQAFVRTLEQVGQVDGRTMQLDERGAGVKAGLADVAADLVRRRVDLIVADGLAAAQAARQATSAIPVVMVGVADPVRLGLVRSLPRPGGNITGLAIPFADLAAKQMQLLREAVPETRAIAVLWNPGNPQHAPTLPAVERAGQTIGVRLRLLEARTASAEELAGVFSIMDRESIRGVLVLSDPQFYGSDLKLFALRHRVAAITQHREFAQGGGLMSYGPHRLETPQRAAYYVDKVLRGTKPADLPVEEPTRYELIVNLVTAKALALTLPPSVLARADEVIE